MNANTRIVLKALAAATLAVSLPTTASVDPAFMREMARTDGNPQGDYAIPTLSDYTLSRLEKQKHDAFLAQLARTDGNVVPPQEEAPSDTTVARR